MYYTIGNLLTNRTEMNFQRYVQDNVTCVQNLKIANRTQEGYLLLYIINNAYIMMCMMYTTRWKIIQRNKRLGLVEVITKYPS